MLLKSIFLFSVLFTVPIWAAEGAYKPNLQPVVEIPYSPDMITIDGILDDNLWLDAARVDNFSEFSPGDRTKPKVKTEALITFTDAYLYVAFICEDDSGLVRASLQDRDKIWQDDYVGVLIDTYGNSNWAYFMFSNPIGIQGDTRYSTTAGEDVSFDLIYQSEGRITGEGFQVEMAIPFSSLRFPDRDVQNWRINFWRNRPRESRYQYSWAALSKDNPCMLCQFGNAVNIKNITPASAIEILPYFSASQSAELNNDEPRAKFNEGSVLGHLGGNVKWSVTPSLTIEGTVNPDFSQVESDAGKIDVNSTFALYYPERRPFFQEGSDLFDTWINIVYTRSINNPLTAAKLIGRWENSTLAYLGSYDEETPLILPFEERSRLVNAGKSFSNIMRFKHQFGENNYFGLLLSDRRLNEGGILNYGFDGLYRFRDNYQLEFQLMAATTSEPDDTAMTSAANHILFNNENNSAAFDGESFSGAAFYGSFERNAKHWSFDIDYRETAPTFRTGNGFIAQNNNRRLFVNSRYTFYFDNHPLFEEIEPFIRLGRIWNYSGLIKDEWIYPAVFLKLKGQIYAEIGYFTDNENYARKQFDAINRFSVDFESQISEAVSFGFNTRIGNYIDRRNLVKGHGIQEFEAWGTIKPKNNFFIEPSFSYAELIRNDTEKYAFAGSILRIRFNYQYSRELFLRLITQLNNFNKTISFEPLISYKMNPFTIFYAGVTQNNKNYTGRGYAEIFAWTTTSRQYFMKLQYLFNL